MFDDNFKVKVGMGYRDMKNTQNYKHRFETWWYSSKYRFILVVLFSSIITFITIFEFATDYKSINKIKHYLFPYKFSQDSNTLNILILRFERIEEYTDRIKKTEKELEKNLNNRKKEDKLPINVYYDEYETAENVNEIESLGRKKNANVVLYGDYDEVIDSIKIKYVYLFKDTLTQVLIDTASSKIEIQKEQFYEFNQTKFFPLNIIDISQGLLPTEIHNIIYWTLALSQYEQKKYNETLNLIDKIKLNTDSSEINIYKTKAFCQYYIKDYKNLILTYNSLILLESYNYQLYSNRGLTHYNLGHFEEAAIDYQKCIDLYPYSSDLYFNMGNSLLRLGRHEEAIQYYSSSLKLNPFDFQVLTNRGSSYLLLGLDSLCEADYIRAYEIDRNNFTTTETLRQFYLRRGKLAKADSLFFGHIKNNPNSPMVFIDNAENYFQLGRYEECIAECSKFIALNPKTDIPYKLIAVCYSKLGQHYKSLEYYNRYIDLNKKDAQAYLNRGVEHHYFGNFGAAFSDVNKSIELKPDYYEAYCTRGLHYGRNNYYFDALNDFSKAIKLKPENSIAYENRSSTHFQMGKYKEALNDINKAFLLNPKLEIEYGQYRDECKRKSNSY